MKYSILLLFSILILSCNENESRENIFYPIPDAKHFDYCMIDSLHIDKMKRFWDTNSVISISECVGDTCDLRGVGFIQEIHYESGPKRLNIYFFDEHASVIDFMNGYFYNSPLLWEVGESSRYNGNWIYTPYDTVHKYYSVNINQWNTLIEISYSEIDDFNEIENLIYNTADTIIKRMENYTSTGAVL